MVRRFGRGGCSRASRLADGLGKGDQVVRARPGRDELGHQPHDLPAPGSGHPAGVLAEPHSYDLCSEHAGRMTAPRGWEVVRLMPELIPTGPSPDGLVALAEAGREAGRPRTSGAPEPMDRGDGVRRGHLRVLPAYAITTV